MNWFTSDLHFGHPKIIDLSHRPFGSLVEMHEELIRRWNSCVRPEDTVYVLGDVALCSFKEFAPLCRRLNGKKILVIGNHDHYSYGQYHQLGFEAVYEELVVSIAGKRVRLSHFPYMVSWYRRWKAYKSELRYPHLRPTRGSEDFLMHGHSHVKWKRHGNRLHIGVDAWDYYPVGQREIESLMSKPE